MNQFKHVVLSLTMMLLSAVCSAQSVAEDTNFKPTPGAGAVYQDPSTAAGGVNAVKPGVKIFDSPDAVILALVKQGLTTLSGEILPMATMWLISFMFLQFFITNVNLLKTGGDIENVFAKLIGSLMWFGVCFYAVTNGPAIIQSTGEGIISKFGANLPNASDVLILTGEVAVILGTAMLAVGALSNTAGDLFLLVLLLILFCGSFVAIKVMMITIELTIITVMAPISFAFMGLQSFREQGIAPIKSLVSLIYRIILLSVFCAAFSKTISSFVGMFKQNYTGIDAIKPWNVPGMLLLFVYLILSLLIIMFLVYKSDSIAASLSNGSSSLGPADVASAAAAGAALGVAAAGAAGATPKLPSIGDSMKGGVSAMNASTSGSGGSGAAPPSAAPQHSKSGNAASSSAPSSPPSRAGGLNGGSQSSDSFNPGPGSGADAGISGNRSTSSGSSPQKSDTKEPEVEKTALQKIVSALEKPAGQKGAIGHLAENKHQITIAGTAQHHD